MASEMRQTSRIPVGSSEDPDFGWPLALAVILALALVQVVLAAAGPLDGDETYYWEWSRRLAPGYFDHPPAIAVLIRAGVEGFGVSRVGVRIVPIVANLGGFVIILLLARRLAGNTAALRSALALVCMPLTAAWLIVATPDVPLLLANAMALYAIVRALEQSPKTLRSTMWWIAAGLALGLGLQSKYTAALLPLGVLIALLSNRDLRRRVAEPGPWVAVLIAAAIFAPVFIWNVENDGALGFQIRHGFESDSGSLLLRELDLVVRQMASVGGILFALIAVAVIQALRSPRDPTRYLLAVVALTSFLVFGVSAMRNRVEANWPAPAYTSAVVLLATAAGGVSWRRWLRAGYVMGGIAVVLIWIQWVHPVLPLSSQKGAFRRGHGWDLVAARVEQVRTGMSDSARGRVWIAGNRYQDASELAFNLPNHPTTFSLNLQSRTNQYAFWPTFSEAATVGDDMIFLSRLRGSPVPLLLPHFDEGRMLDSIGPTPANPETPSREIWVLEGWRGSWPVVDTSDPQSPLHLITSER